jgi:putative oxidoreductase
MRIYEKGLYNMKKILVVLNQWSFSYIDIGLLLFRLGLGGMFMWHGYPKITGGIEKWAALGKSMEVFGITFAPAFWGFMSGFAEFVGGFLLTIGFLYRPACLLLVSNMLVAFSTQMLSGAGLAKASQSFEDGFSFFAAFFVGPGKYSLDELLGVNSSRKARFSKYE